MEWVDIKEKKPKEGSRVLYFVAPDHYEVADYPTSPFHPLAYLPVTHWAELEPPQ